jgi:transcription termination factor Rho
MTESKNTVTGVIKLTRRDGGVLVDPKEAFPEGPPIQVGPQMIRDHHLISGCTVVGQVKQSGRRVDLVSVESVCGMAPADFARRPSFSDLVAIDPNERIEISRSGDPAMRIIDMIAPIGKGTRAMIVSPPKAGKTMILESFAHSIHQVCPDMRIIVLLIDERPEEVTHFRRAVKAEVFARTNDQPPLDQVDLVELILAMVRTELECGKDVTILMDSITRIGRAFNVKGSGTRRTMSGGMEAGALEIPRRLFGLARNIENGGSVTIIATALIDTGSQMDQLIFQEFKGTGNCEVVLDRKLAEQRVFPAINIMESGTRKEELLYDADSIGKIALIRRGLADRPPQQAMEKMLELIGKHKTNEALLKSIPKL